MTPAAALLVLMAALVLPLSACGDDAADPGRVCGPAVIEQLDPDGGHLIAGVTPPSYLTDPPTSGPHTPGLGVAGGVRAEPLSPIQQVSTLENGIVIVQYRDDADADAVTPLAGTEVVVAPNPDLPARVVATAWARKVTCTEVDTSALRSFIRSTEGQHTGHVTTTTSTTTVGA